MASTSSSIPPCKYDVFISFRGKDVRYGFLSHLSAALHQKQIHAFTDENLRKGEDISPALLKIIQESCVSIVIFSANYADSPWCLDELVKILECKDTLGQLVLPVFYHVDPTEVQELTGKFGKAFAIARYGEQLKGRSHKVDGWKHALMEVSNLSGWDSQNVKYESKLIEEIVNDILKKFSHMCLSNDSYDHNLIGIESRVGKVERLLNDKRVVGIWGMGGIGKTTIAQELFHRNKTKFDGHYFVDKVRETMTKQPSIVIRDQIICRLLREKNFHENTLDLDVFIRRRLKSKKILIVFDDVDDPNHLKSLAGECDLYGEGSRIIVTSRDQQVLKNFCSKDCIYEVEKLINSEDLKLFCLHAFKQNHPKEGYMELSKGAITYARGNPLALIVLGSHLFDMGIEEWKCELKRLKGQSLKKIQDVLKISYDGLERNEKKIFLDIACFFKGENKDCVERTLEACGFFAKSAIPRLINKSLINITNDKVDMHDLLQQMGKDIVIEECKQPGGRSRLLNHEDIHHVLTTDTGNENVEGILAKSSLNDLEISSTAFMKMRNLRFLKICKRYFGSQVLLPDGLKFLPEKLRYLYWHKYPLKSLPPDFSPKNLVELHLPESKLVQLWNGYQPLGNLKLMDLSHSKHLIRIPDLSIAAPNLEFLYLRECESLNEIPSSLQDLGKLTELDLLKCYNVTDCPEIPCNIRVLTLDETGIEQLPSSIEHLSQLVKLSLSGCTRLVSVPSSIVKWKRLEKLFLDGCSRLVSIPSCIGELKCLEEFHLNGCSRLPSLPESICKLKSLTWLDVSDCLNLNALPDSLGDLEFLNELYADGSGIRTLPSSINQLRELEVLRCRGCDCLTILPPLAGLSLTCCIDLRDCGILEIPETVCLLDSLVELDLDGNNIESIPACIKQLSKLKWLSLSGCKRLKCLPELPSCLEDLNASDCTSLESASTSFLFLDHEVEDFFEDGKRLVFRNCVNLEKKVCGDVLEAHSARKIDVTLCIPGSEVPQGMRHKNTSGSSLSFRLDLHHLVAFSFCAVFDPSYYSYDLRKDIICRVDFTDESGRKCGRDFFFNDDYKYSSEHILLWFGDYVFHYVDEECFVEATFHFPIRNPSLIIKCGIHPIYQHENDEGGEPSLERWIEQIK